jgi:CheY-like chemotaxis protein
MSKTILVVDDEMLIALDIQSQLEELGHTVHTAPSLASALALLERERIDVAIVDWHLQKDISAPLTEFLRQRGVPFVLCSGTGFDELAALFPAIPILPKPFASDELLNVLEQVAPGTVH